MEPATPQNFKKILPASSCGPAFKLCLPSEMVSRFMTKFVDMEFELREATSAKSWRVSIGPRRNKAKFEYLLLGWRSVCEQTKMQVGDEVLFTMYDAHMEFSVARNDEDSDGNPSLSNPSAPEPLYHPPGTSSSADKLHIDGLQKIEGCMDVKPMAGYSLSWPMRPTPQPFLHPSFSATSRTALDGSAGDPHDTLDQVLNLSIGLGLEGLLDSNEDEHLLSSSPVSSQVQRGKHPMMTPDVSIGNSAPDNLFYDSPMPGTRNTKAATSLVSNWPFMSPRSNSEGYMSWVPQPPSQDEKHCKAFKRRYETLESPWKKASSTEPLPSGGMRKSEMASPPLSTARTAPVKGSPGVRLQGDSVSEQSMQVLQGAMSADIGGELAVLRRALQQERERADGAEEDSAHLLQAMKGAEMVVGQQSGVGMEGIGKIFDAANHLVSAEMLHHLDLSKAQGLGALQIQLKHQANLVLEALSQIQALTGRQIKASPKSENTESTTLPPWRPSPASTHW